MRVLFVSNLFPPNIVGGYEQLCHAVAGQFEARGHEVAVITSCFGGNEPADPGYSVHPALQLLVGANIYKEFSGSRELRAALEACNRQAFKTVVDTFQPDVVFCWNLYGLGLDFLDALKSEMPVVVMLTDNWLLALRNPEYWSAYYQRCVKGGERSIANSQRSFREGVRAIFGSNYVRNLYSAAGFEFDHACVIHNGVNLPTLRERSNERLHRSSAAPFRLLFAGRIVDIKGIETAIAAQMILAKKEPGKYHMDVVGAGQDLDFVQRMKGLAYSDLGSGIEFHPPVSEERLAQMFEQADAYVFPSLYEPFSLTLILAQAAGAPTIASRVGGNIEIVEDGVTGLLFDAGDVDQLVSCIERLKQDPDLGIAVSKEAVKRAQKFSFASMVSGMEAYLEKTIEDAQH